MTLPTLAVAMTTYVAMRDDIAKKEKEFKAYKADLKDKQATIEKFLITTCESLGTESVTGGGFTAFITSKDSVSISDKTVLMSHVVETLVSALPGIYIDATNLKPFLDAAFNSCAFDILTISANKNNCKTFMGDNGGVMPPGVAYDKRQVVQVRKSGAKK